MNEKQSIERLDKIIKRLDMITVILLVNSGFTRKEIAKSLGVSEKTIERLISVSKIKRNAKKSVIEDESVTKVELSKE